MSQIRAQKTPQKATFGHGCNKLKFYAATIKLSLIDKKWKISALQLIDKQIVDYQQSLIVNDLQFLKNLIFHNRHFLSENITFRM